jgi:hypothetical protein
METTTSIATWVTREQCPPSRRSSGRSAVLTIEGFATSSTNRSPRVPYGATDQRSENEPNAGHGVSAAGELCEDHDHVYPSRCRIARAVVVSIDAARGRRTTWKTWGRAAWQGSRAAGPGPAGGSVAPGQRPAAHGRTASAHGHTVAPHDRAAAAYGTATAYGGAASPRAPASVCCAAKSAPLRCAACLCSPGGPWAA